MRGPAASTSFPYLFSPDGWKGNEGGRGRGNDFGNELMKM